MIIVVQIQLAIYHQIDYALKNNSFPHEKLEIYINLDARKKCISICDNANGIPSAEVENRLGNVADSYKVQGETKGFRGIGRLGGIGYCKQLRFITSYAGEDVKSIMTWDAARLREIISDPQNHKTAEEVLGEIIHIDHKPCEKEKHFFEVEMNEINSENDALLDFRNIKQYLSEVAPVDFNETFYLDEKINKFLDDHKDEIPHPQTYNIFLVKNGGSMEQIHKGYGTTIYKLVQNNKKERWDSLYDIHTDIIRNSKGLPIAWIWYGISSFRGAITLSVNPMRGLRLRQFNIQIGDRDTLSASPKFFKEDRGNSYFIGEVHTIDKNLRPNARRDYFNESSATSDFEYALKEYISNHLDSLYQAGSKVNSSYDKLKKYTTLKEELKRREQQGFASPYEREKMKQNLEEAHKKAETAVKNITRIEERAKNQPNSDLAQMFNAIEKTQKIDFKHVLETPNEDGSSAEKFKGKTNKTTLKSEKSKTKSKIIESKKPKLMVDELANLTRSERKLVSRIYDVINENLIIDEANSLITKIQEELKKPHVS